MRRITFNHRLLWLTLVFLLTGMDVGRCHDAQAATVAPLQLGTLQEATLKGGLKVRLVERRDLPLVTLRLVIRAGSAAEAPGKEGLARFTAELLRAGAGSRDVQALAETLDGMGASLEVRADRDATVIVLECLSRDLEQALAVLADLVMRPTFPEAELERTRRQTLAELAAVMDEPSDAADVAFMAQLYRGHPYGHSPLGREETVKSFGVGDVRDFHTGHYRPENAFVVAVGDFKAGELKKQLARAFGGWEALLKGKAAAKSAALPAPTQVTGTRVLVVNRPGLTQAQLRLGNVGMAAGDPDEVLLQVANTALGGGFTSRLVEEIRVNRSLSYGASSRFTMNRVPGPFTVTTFTKNETVGETLRVALDTVASFQSKGMAAPEFEKAQNFALGRFATAIETPEGLAGSLSRLELYGLPLQQLTDYPVRVGAATREEVNASLKRIPVENCLILLYADYSAVKDQLRGFGEVVVVDSIEPSGP